jgi:hypothetical protein
MRLLAADTINDGATVYDIHDHDGQDMENGKIVSHVPFRYLLSAVNVLDVAHDTRKMLRGYGHGASQSQVVTSNFFRINIIFPNTFRSCTFAFQSFATYCDGLLPIKDRCGIALLLYLLYSISIISISSVMQLRVMDCIHGLSNSSTTASLC